MPYYKASTRRNHDIKELMLQIIKNFIYYP